MRNNRKAQEWKRMTFSMTPDEYTSLGVIADDVMLPKSRTIARLIHEEVERMGLQIGEVPGDRYNPRDIAVLGGDPSE